MKTMIELSGTTILVMRALWEQRPLIEAATEFGATVVAVDEDDDAEGLDLAAVPETVTSLRDLNDCLAIADKHNVDAVISDECDYSFFTCSYLGERLELPAIDLATAQVTTNKKRMRRQVGESVIQPAYRVCTTLAEVRAAVEDISLPCVVKPTDNRGGFGVSRVTKKSDIPAAFYDALAKAHSREVLVEKFIEGVPISIDGYCFDDTHHSLAVGSKNTSMGSLHPSLQIQYPAAIDQSAIRTAKRINDLIADTLGISMGATHAEYIYADEEFHLLEFQNRGGGVHTSAKIVPELTGFDVSTQLLADATRQQTGQEFSQYRMEGACIMDFLDFEPGYVTDITGINTIRDRDDVLTFRLYFDTEQEIEDFNTFTDSHGVIITTGETPAAARHSVDKALSEFEIVYNEP
jgi:biotin carboxylase